MKKFEKKEMIIVLSILFLISEFLFLFSLFIEKDYIYKSITGVVMQKNKVIFLVNEEEKKEMDKNSYVYYENKKRKIEILEDHGIVLKKGKQSYREILLKIKTGNKLKEKDSLTVAMKEKKIRKIEILKKIWDGD